ncbi:MAG TPA: SurA N-terminal domain-containing protein [Abditibacteriaceae bacterium]|jgi:hypothetical protein
MTLITQKSGKDDKNTAKGSAVRGSAVKGTDRSRRTLREDDYEGTPFSMSRIRSGLLQSTAVKIVLGLLIVIFAFTFLLAGIGNNSSLGGGQGRVSGNETIAQVAGTNITRSEFQNSLEQQMRVAAMFGQQPGPTDMLMLRQQTLQSLANQAGTIQAARDAGITVSGAEIDAKITKEIDDQIKQEKSSNAADFRRRVEAQFSTEQAYRDELRNSVNREAVERQLLLEKFEQSTKEQNRVSEEDYKRSVSKMLLRQIVVRPKPPAATEKNFQAAQEKSATAAREKIDALARQLKAAQPAVVARVFTGMAKAQSDDAATKARGGLLGWKLPTQLTVGAPLQTALTAATTTPAVVGPLQDEVTRNFYLFLIENRRPELPKDYAKKKAQYLKDFETQRDNEAWAKRQEAINTSTQAEIYDPALVAYRIQNQQLLAAPAEQQNALREEALQKYEEALQGAGSTESAAIHFQMAQLYQALNQPAKRIQALQAALRESSDATMVRLELARALREQKKPKEALTQLNEASKELAAQPASPSAFGGGSPAAGMHMQLAMEYDQLGRKDLANAQRQLAIPPQGAPGMGGGMPPGLSGAMPPGGATRTIPVPGRP